MRLLATMTIKYLIASAAPTNWAEFAHAKITSGRSARARTSVAIAAVAAVGRSGRLCVAVACCCGLSGSATIRVLYVYFGYCKTQHQTHTNKKRFNMEVMSACGPFLELFWDIYGSIYSELTRGPGPT